ncbi:MAG TPA: hypothetical protein VGB04_05605 [Allosphingosinicella sp.]|jgi:hypothetical protein
MQDCRLDFQVDPEVVNMDLDTFRGFVNDTCIPVFYETLATVKSKADSLDGVLTAEVRGGEGSISCSADNHGNVRCEGSVSIRW